MRDILYDKKELKHYGKNNKRIEYCMERDG